ncbi:MAG TPA: LemA family protein [Gammaproteobacteria bacterium]|jgi:LemA protein|nr:LemA family protein [Gammaproteobacteria bacterium]
MASLRIVARILISGLLLGALFALSGCGINNIPRYDQQVKANWAQVQNEYQRRADLVPNLVATVKGYATHEDKVLDEVTEARAKVGQMQVPKDILTNPQAFKQFEQNQGQLTTALQHLMVVTENYPNLKANENFLALQSQLEGTENRIAVARRDYILAVQQYNTELTTIPGRWYRSMFYSDKQVMQNFSADEASQAAPKVQF